MNRITEIILRNASPLEPLPAGALPRLHPLPGIRAVVFDVYGTLVISGSGDISLAGEEDRGKPLHDAFAACGAALEAGRGLDLSALFHQTIHAHQDRRRSEGIAFPEVDIREVWADFTSHLRQLGVIRVPFDADSIETLATEYETRSNPVWPMPEMLSTLEAIDQAGLLLGIVSNAQFYTPIMLEAFAGTSLSALGFQEDCCVWSYRQREGKPSAALYQVLAERLAAHGIAPGQCLYIGNDMRNDIVPASLAGFRTALFAADARSLRLRPEDPAAAHTSPDLVLTHLDQIPEALRAG